MRHRFLVWLSWLTLGLLFALAYAQSPLYTSNQNQYFLHGLAAAGYGYLGQDWLANTLDPTPVFSKLVEWSYRLFHQEALFYGYYAILMVVYLVSLLHVAQRIFFLPQASQRLALVALFTVIHSAALRFALSRLIGTNWTYILEDGVADQRMLGSVFQPSVFGVCLALSIAWFVSGKPYAAVWAAIAAATVHPTYLFSAAVLTLTYALITLGEERYLKRPLGLGASALILVSPTLYMTLRVFGSTSPELTAQAQNILVNYRIPHHALVSWWLDATAVTKLAVIGAALFILFAQRPPRGSARARLGYILLITTLVAAVFTLIQALSHNYALALLFPWRLSIFIVPISTTVLLGYAVEKVLRMPGFQTKPVQDWLLVGGFALIFLAAISGGMRFILDLQRKDTAPERGIQAFIATHKRPDDLYLIPVKMQDFRLESGAAAFIDFKSIPYKDVEVLEWYRRLRLADQFYKERDCTLLGEMAIEYNLSHVILETSPPPPECEFLRRVYEDEHYALYRIVASP